MKKLKFDPKNWDWYAFIDDSEEVKLAYEEQAEDLASSWITCACGQVCSVLPKRFESMCPLDNELMYLGNSFHAEIDNKKWEEAKEILDKIEARTIFLLKQPNFIDPKTL